jgi:cobyrinic acid a,c-diamide synthase
MDKTNDSGRQVIPPRFMISAPCGRSGKTIVSIGLCNAFRKRGLIVQPFKKGPDYIDPSWLSAAAGKICRNLDGFLMDEEVLCRSFTDVSLNADLAIIEGNMGLYDGIDEEGKGSSAYLARLLRIPIILVVNTARMTRSIAALVSGYQHFEPGTPVAGVILNNVSGPRHEKKLVDAVERHCRIPVLGAIPRDNNIAITERHLGLIPFKETGAGTDLVERLSAKVEAHVNLDGILSVAEKADEYPANVRAPERARESVVRIGVVFDQVFNFYYPENLEALVASGAELVFINSLKDRRLPHIDGLYVGGGFPELYLEELTANRALMDDIASAIEEGLPVYAECAGLMFLSKGIIMDGKLNRMVGVIPVEVELSKRPQGHGYVEAEVVSENPFFPLGTALRGHEFHHSRIVDAKNVRSALNVGRGKGIDGTSDGIVYKNLYAAYTHLHALGTPRWAEAFVSLSLRGRKGEPSRAAMNT